MNKQILTAAAAMLAANDQTPFYPAFTNGAGPSGTIFAANDANFDAQFLAEPLRDYVVSFPDEEGLQAALDAVAPMIPVSRSFTYRKHDSREHFQIDADNADIRVIGGEFAQVRLTGTQESGKTKNKGLVIVLDEDEGGDDPTVQKNAVVNLRNRLLRTELYRAIVLLDANDNSTSSTWTSGSADPDGVATARVDAAGDKRGINSNLIVWGGGAWVKRLVQLRALLTPGAAASLPLTPDQAAKLCGAERGVVLPFRYQSAATESTKSKVAGDVVFTYYAKNGMSGSDPSNIKRFVTVTDGGLKVYIEKRLKRTFVSVEHYSDLICTSTLGIEKIAVS